VRTNKGTNPNRKLPANTNRAVCFLVRPGSSEPIGGVQRFQSVVNHYRSGPRFAALPDLLTFFSGDAFNPSLESTVTKGRHMIPFLNKAGTDVACVGVRRTFHYLTRKEKFWKS
jgi:hypothetical protein